jgi:thiamine-phosphate pyrophosphorylase
LRVVEDYLRFVLDDAHLTGLAKSLRHRLAELVMALPAEERHAARETQQDVGTRISTLAEQVRPDAAAVALASFQRTEQALRSLEEFSKPLNTELAAGFEQLRYAVYTLEKAADLTRSSLSRLADARLCVLVDGRASLDEFARLVESLVSAGVDMLQLRDKRLADRMLLERARKLRQLTRGTSSLAIINDRPDIAALSDADGVHVGQDELSVHQARQIVGPRALIGVSTHNLAQAQLAVLDGASYLGVGPTFPSRTKEFADFPGPAFVAQVASEIRLPAFAIGGIDARNVSQVISAGLRRVAVGSAVVDAADPAAAVRELRELLGGGL